MEMKFNRAFSTARKNEPKRRLTHDVEREGRDGADEGEDDQEPAGGRVAADQVLGPVLHVRVERRLGQYRNLGLGPNRRLPALLLVGGAADLEEEPRDDDQDGGEQEDGSGEDEELPPVPVLQAADLHVGADERLVDEGDVLRNHLGCVMTLHTQIQTQTLSLNCLLLFLEQL